MTAQKIQNVEQAWLAYRRKMYAFIRSKIEVPEDAEDILNDVFLSLTKAVNERVIPDNVSAWLYRVAKNRIVDHYRSSRKFETLPDDLVQDIEGVDVIKQLSQCILPMIQALPQIYQQSLMLSEIEGKTYKALAVELDLTVPAIKSRILRGRQLLHKSMARCCLMHRNAAGELVDFDSRLAGSCQNC